MPNTTNHNVPLPTVGASADTWGGENNDAHQAWDTLTSGAQNTILGRVASGSGPMTQLTTAQVRDAITNFTGDAGSGGVKGMVPAPAAGDGASGKALMASGGWGYPGARAIGRFNGTTGATVNARGVSVSRTGVGQYNVTLSPVMADANYIVDVPVETILYRSSLPAIKSKTASGFTVELTRTVYNSPSSDFFDPEFLSVIVYVV